MTRVRPRRSAAGAARCSGAGGMHSSRAFLPGPMPSSGVESCPRAPNNTCACRGVPPGPESVMLRESTISRPVNQLFQDPFVLMTRGARLDFEHELQRQYQQETNVVNLADARAKPAPGRLPVMCSRKAGPRVTPRPRQAGPRETPSPPLPVTSPRPQGAKIK